MVKFKFDYRQNRLACQKHDCWQEITEQFEGNFGSQGFQLTDGWITFTVYSNKIRVFYKQIQPGVDPTDFWEPQQITYFRKDLPKTLPIIFTFTSQDQVEKNAGQWRRKHE